MLYSALLSLPLLSFTQLYSALHSFTQLYSALLRVTFACRGLHQARWGLYYASLSFTQLDFSQLYSALLSGCMQGVTLGEVGLYYANEVEDMIVQVR